jgi:hypothetical protein
VRHFLRGKAVSFRIDRGRVPADRWDEKVLAEAAFRVLSHALGELLIESVAGSCRDRRRKSRRAP